MSDEDKITIQCSSCGKQFKAPAKLAGQKARCPCGQILDVPPKMESEEGVGPGEAWYYLHEGDREGPVSQDELESLIGDGSIESTARVWKQGMESWKPAVEVEQLGVEEVSEGAGAVDEEGKEEEAEKEKTPATEEQEEGKAEAEEKVAVKKKPEEPAAEEEAEEKPDAEESASSVPGKTARKRRSRPAGQKKSGLPQLVVTRVIAWGLIGVGAVCLVGALVLSIISLVQTGLSGGIIADSVGGLAAGGLMALFSGATLRVGRSIAQSLRKIAQKGSE